MKNDAEPTHTIILAKGYGSAITIRCKRESERYPTHMPVRILVGSTVHLVQKNDVMRMEAGLVFRPEQKWKMCPHCNQPKWSVWMPVSVQMRVTWDSDEEAPEERTALNWYILCQHCKCIVADHTSGPYCAEDIKEFVYDPADDIQLKLWAETPP